MNRRLLKGVSKNISLMTTKHLGFKAPLRSMVAALLIVSLALNIVIQPSTAKADFDANAEAASSKAEFQGELDKWLPRAYEGNRDAQFKVAALFANNQFSPPDHKLSAHWYTQAAQQGHALAQYNLGHQYLVGVGLERNEKAAMQWWLKAAKQQHALAQFNVGRAYYLGIGLDKDLSQAKFWFEQASQNKEPKSTEILKQLGWWHPNTAPKTGQPDQQKREQIQETRLTNTSRQRVTSSLPSNSVPAQSSSAGKPIAVFTNPAINSVLISVVDSADTLKEVSTNKLWSIVTNAGGLPVWVKKNFIQINGNKGLIIANSVNARAVPKVSKGSVVGRLNKGDAVTVIDRKSDWYRIYSPESFKAWVKTADFARATSIVNGITPKDKTKNANSSQQALMPFGKKLDDNEWLFKQPADHYSLQLGSFKETSSVTRFLESLPFRNSEALQLFTTTTGEGLIWTYVIYGNFSSNDEAKSARTKLKQQQAWIRRFGVLQQNRCTAWRKELPAPEQLNKFCV